jgi:hypothetical protein
MVEVNTWMRGFELNEHPLQLVCVQHLPLNRAAVISLIRTKFNLCWTGLNSIKPAWCAAKRERLEGSMASDLGTANNVWLIVLQWTADVYCNIEPKTEMGVTLAPDQGVHRDWFEIPVNNLRMPSPPTKECHEDVPHVVSVVERLCLPTF